MLAKTTNQFIRNFKKYLENTTECEEKFYLKQNILNY